MNTTNATVLDLDQDIIIDQAASTDNQNEAAMRELQANELMWVGGGSGTVIF